MRTKAIRTTGLSRGWVVLLVTAMLVAMGSVAQAEEIEWRTTSHVTKADMTPGGGYTYTRRGIAFFKSGEVATHLTNGASEPAVAGKLPYKIETVYIFEDYATITIRAEGTSKQSGGRSDHAGSGEFVGGTGRFEGITGSFTFTGRGMARAWSDIRSDDNYTDFVGTYTLPKK